MPALRSVAVYFIWALVIAGSVYFFLDNVVAYFYGYRSRMFGNSFWHNQFWVTLHMVGGSLTLLLGPTQFWPAVRKRYVRFHRTSGKIYMAGIAMIGLSAGRLSFISTCVPCRISLFLLTVFAVLSTALAWRAILVRNTKVHRQMMVRSYICVLAFVAVRIDDVYALDFLFGPITDPTFRRVVNEYFFSFVPLILAEIVMVWLPSVKWSRQKSVPAKRATAVNH